MDDVVVVAGKRGMGGVVVVDEGVGEIKSKIWVRVGVAVGEAISSSSLETVGRGGGS